MELRPGLLPSAIRGGCSLSDEADEGKDSMKFGMLYELQIPKPWHPKSEYNVFWEAMEQIVTAEEMGFEYVWLVEHHFLTEFAHSCSPEVFLGALSPLGITWAAFHTWSLYGSPDLNTRGKKVPPQSHPSPAPKRC